jgi:hypothetical protein
VLLSQPRCSLSSSEYLSFLSGPSKSSTKYTGPPRSEGGPWPEGPLFFCDAATVTVCFLAVAPPTTCTRLFHHACHKFKRLFLSILFIYLSLTTLYVFDVYQPGAFEW